MRGKRGQASLRQLFRAPQEGRDVKDLPGFRKYSPRDVPLQVLGSVAAHYDGLTADQVKYVLAKPDSDVYYVSINDDRLFRVEDGEATAIDKL
jgi:hypothetical protein